jgi:hypothetical protein
MLHGGVTRVRVPRSPDDKDENLLEGFNNLLIETSVVILFSFIKIYVF